MWRKTEIKKSLLDEIGIFYPLIDKRLLEQSKLLCENVDKVSAEIAKRNFPKTKLDDVVSISKEESETI